MGLSGTIMARHGTQQQSTTESHDGLALPNGRRNRVFFAASGLFAHTCFFSAQDRSRNEGQKWQHHHCTHLVQQDCHVNTPW